MNRITIRCKKSVIRFLQSRLFCVDDRIINYRCLTHLAKPYKLCKTEVSFSKALIFQNYYREMSNSNSDPKSDESVVEEFDQKILEDVEFKNILKDFSKDFGLGSESEKILEDIKKSLDESNIVNKNGSSSKTVSKSNSINENKEIYLSVKDKYKEFSESDSKIIPSYEDISSGACDEDELTYHIDQNSNFHVPKVQPKRGISGVYDIDELVEILHQENLSDISVISIPKEYHYADFLVLATAKSPRHSKAVAEYVIKLYKMKRHKSDPFIVVEGEKVSNWKAIDMSNIVLHIFLEETRAFYDIESLWVFDSEFDSGGTLKPDPVFDAIQEEMAFFSNLQESSLKESKNEIT